jgi:multimeric flavodoxin WrbA
MNILGITGSPRKNGNTESLIKEVLRGAKESSSDTEIIRLSDVCIEPCQACDSCKKTGTCIKNDDFNTLVSKMKQSKAWILGTPVYYWGPTAFFKAFVDRWYGLSKEVFRGKKTVLVIPLGASSKNYSRHTVGMLKDALNYQGVNHLGTILALNSGSRESVRNNNQLLKEAYEYGKLVSK